MIASFQMDRYNILKINIDANIVKYEMPSLLYVARFKIMREEDHWKGNVILAFRFVGDTEDEVLSDITILGSFHAVDDIDRVQFEKMLKINGASTLIPIARAAFVSTYALMGFAPMRSIPNINVMKLNWSEIKEHDL